MSKNVMLAHCYDPDKHQKKVDGWWLSEKYDGVRGKWNGEEMESRTGKIYTLPDFITEQLLQITDEDGEPMELDGEIWFGRDTFAIASGAARKSKNDPELWKQMTYMIFDIPEQDTKFEDRVKKLGKALKNAGELPNVKGVKYRKFNKDTMSIGNELKKVEDLGGEGIMLRKPGSLYVYTRSNDMLKVKSWMYKEAEVLGYVEGSGKYKGMVGSLLVRSDQFESEEDEEGSEKKWTTFKVGSGLNDWQRYSGDVEGNWKSKETQQEIDEERKELQVEIDKMCEDYAAIIETIKTETGKKKNDALHELNMKFTEMPLISSIITFRYKELTKDGNPSMPTFVGCRNYE